MTRAQKQTLDLIESSVHVLSADIMMDNGDMIVETRSRAYVVNTYGTITQEDKPNED